MPGHSHTPPHEYHRRSSPLSNPSNVLPQSTFPTPDSNLHQRAQQIEQDIKRLQFDLHHRSQGLERKLQVGDKNAIRTMRKLLLSTFVIISFHFVALRNEHRTIMNSIDQALAAVDAHCPPMTSSEPDYCIEGRDKENINPINRHKESVDPVLIDALVKRVNHAITPPSNTKGRIHDLQQRVEGPAFDKRRILDGLPPIISNTERDDLLPVEMSVASMDYLRRHDLLTSSRNDHPFNGHQRWCLKIL